MRDPREPPAADGYQRPQQAWHCGLADEGPPCPLGPDLLGHCPAAAACRPVRDGDRWHCNRSALRGGPCATGPGSDGVCAVVYCCMPVRSLRVRRGRFVAGFAVAVAGVLCMVLSGSWRNEFISPGPLAAHHAQLIEGQSLRCAQCHAAAESTVREWWTQSTDGQPTLPAQSVLCLECHRETTPEQFAMAAHGMSLDKLIAVSGQSRASEAEHRLRDPHQPIACAACHHDHHGREHDLRVVTNDACQACHREQFDSFAGSHPEFANWPYEKPTGIAFDHSSHGLKHFPAKVRDFACAACHEADRFSVRQLTRGYDATCAECHDKALLASVGEGIQFISLPTIDSEALENAGRPPESWPANVSGDFEGVLPGTMALMLAADPQAAKALAVLGPPYDFYQLDSADATHINAAVELAAAITALIEELSADGPKAISDRMERLLGRPLTKAEGAALQGQLATDLARELNVRWFSPKQQPAGSPTTDRAAQLANVSAAGWLRDDLNLSLRYRPNGHADAWMKAWLDVIAEAATGPRAALAEPLLRATLKPTAPGQCGQCHTLQRTAGGQLEIRWRAMQAEDQAPSFTRFSHAPHLLSMGADCTSCHRTGAEQFRSDASNAGPFANSSAGFQPLTKSACAECHVPKIAGNACTQCHQYHADQHFR